jgi:hypothetical protein
MSRRTPRVGDVIQVTLPTGRYAYGRILRDAGVAFYSGTTAEPGLPPKINGRCPASALESVSAGHGPSVVRPVRQSPVSSYQFVRKLGETSACW